MLSLRACSLLSPLLNQHLIVGNFLVIVESGASSTIQSQSSQIVYNSPEDYFLKPNQIFPSSLSAFVRHIKVVAGRKGKAFKKIRLGVIGSTSQFAKKAHFPSLKDLSEIFEVVATWSYNEPTEETKKHWSHNDTIHSYDTHGWKDMLLRREFIDAMDLVLPIRDQPRYVAEALHHGFHVISEKPVLPRSDWVVWEKKGGHIIGEDTTLNPYFDAPNKVAAHNLEPRTLPSSIWSVSENWRFEPNYVRLFRFLDDNLKQGGKMNLNIPNILSTLNHIELKTLSNIPRGSGLLKPGSWREHSSLWTDIVVHYAAVIRKLLAIVSRNKDENVKLEYVLPSGTIAKSSSLESRDGYDGDEVDKVNSAFEATVTVLFSIKIENESVDVGAGKSTTNSDAKPITSSGLTSSKTVTLIWTNSFATKDDMVKDANQKALSNMIVKLYYNNTENLEVDRWYVRGTQIGQPSQQGKPSEAEKTVLQTQIGTNTLRTPNEFSVLHSLEDFGRAVLSREYLRDHYVGSPDAGGTNQQHFLKNTPYEAYQDLKFIERIKDSLKEFWGTKIRAESSTVSKSKIVSKAEL